MTIWAVRVDVIERRESDLNLLTANFIGRDKQLFWPGDSGLKAGLRDGAKKGSERREEMGIHWHGLSHERGVLRHTRR